MEDPEIKTSYLERRGKRVRGEDKYEKSLAKDFQIAIKKDESVEEDTYRKFKQKSIEASNTRS